MSYELKKEFPMHFLVTGGAGFIGSHIVERLLKEGHFVRVLDNFSSGKLENLSFTNELRAMSYELVRGDIRDYATCQRACSGIDYVLHQAALRSVPKSLEMPHEYNEVNIDGTVNMLKASLENGVKRFVFASSSSIYGEAESFPQKETDPSYLISPYALTKLTGEYYCRIFSLNHGLETVSLRYFNVFGPRQSLDDEYAVVIPKFITCMLDDENPPIHGNGKQSRDFAYIDNVVDANILAATTSLLQIPSPHRGEGKGEGASENSPLPCGERDRVRGKANSKNGTFCEVFNVAAGNDHSILELVDTLNKIMDKNITPKFTLTRPGDVMRTLADITKIKKHLNYQPKASFEEGLRQTVDWFKKSEYMLTT